MDTAEITKDEMNEQQATGSLITLGEFLSNPPDTPASLLGDWLSANTCTMIHAPSGIGKSWLAMGIGLAVAGAGKITSWKSASAKKVLYIDGEMSEHSRFKRFELLSKKMTFGDKLSLNDNLKIIPPEEAFKIDQNISIEHYMSLIKGNDIDLLIIDNIRTLADLKDENSAASWGMVNNFLKALRVHCAVIVVHHDGKRSGYSGSSNAITVLDNQIGLTSLPIYKCVSERMKDAGVKFSYEFHKVRDSFDDEIEGSIGFHDQHGWIKNTSRAVESMINLMETKELVESGRFSTLKELASHLGMSEQALTKRRKKYEKQFGEKMKLVTPKMLESDDTNLRSVFCMSDQE